MKDLVWIIWVMAYPICSNAATLLLYRAKKVAGLPATTEKGYLLDNFVGVVIYIWVWTKLV